MSWSLRTASGQTGANAIEDGALILDGQVYGLCPGFPNPAELQLLDPGATGVVAGVIGYPGKATVQVSESTVGTFDVGTPLPAPAVQVVQGVSFFIGALPESACDYPSLELNATAAGSRRSTISASAPAPPIRSCPSRRARASGSPGSPVPEQFRDRDDQRRRGSGPERAEPPCRGQVARRSHIGEVRRPERLQGRLRAGTASQKLHLVEGANQAVIAAANAAGQAHAEIAVGVGAGRAPGGLHGSERRRRALRDRLSRHPGRRTQGRVRGPRWQHVEGEPGHVLRRHRQRRHGRHLLNHEHCRGSIGQAPGDVRARGGYPTDYVVTAGGRGQLARFVGASPRSRASHA